MTANFQPQHRPLTIPRAEVLRYLGHRPGQDLQEVLPLLDRAQALILDSAHPRAVTARLPFTPVEGGVLVGEALMLPGADITAHLSTSQGECVLLAATLGAEVERAITYRQRMDMALSLVMDATATALIEAYCDDLEEQLRAHCQQEELDLTFRFSPGYGDFPLSLQREFLDVLGAQKAIGLTANSSNLLLPRKSVTAVMGITPHGTMRSPKGCAACGNYHHCPFRKDGITCGC